MQTTIRSVSTKNPPLLVYVSFLRFATLCNSIITVSNLPTAVQTGTVQTMLGGSPHRGRLLLVLGRKAGSRRRYGTCSDYRYVQSRRQERGKPCREASMHACREAGRKAGIPNESRTNLERIPYENEGSRIP